jgi:hypothetical protein
MNVLSTIEIKKGTTVMTQRTGGTSCFVIKVSVTQCHFYFLKCAET